MEGPRRPSDYMSPDPVPQPEVNIGLVGHIDHGKTTLTKALSGVWADTHSEELKRGITIKLGYANTSFYKCPKEKGPKAFTTLNRCVACGGEAKLQRAVSFVDSPGHETLMATMLCGAAIMDGALLVVAANEECPQPQTKEHLMALDIVGVDNIVVVQNKVDLVSREKVQENYQQIVQFLGEERAKKTPIIPISAQHNINVDALIQAIETIIPTPKRDPSADPRMYVARSFDVNRPGKHPSKLVGGVLGGALVQGKLKIGDEIEIRPGIRHKVENKDIWEPLHTTITTITTGDKATKEVTPGGSFGIGTSLDPSLSKADSLSGNLVGFPGKLPPVLSTLDLDVTLLERVVGSKEEIAVDPISPKELFMINVGSATTVGVVVDKHKDHVRVALKRPVCALEGERASLSRRFGARWRLIGYGVI